MRRPFRGSSRRWRPCQPPLGDEPWVPLLITGRGALRRVKDAISGTPDDLERWEPVSSDWQGRRPGVAVLCPLSGRLQPPSHCASGVTDGAIVTTAPEPSARLSPPQRPDETAERPPGAGAFCTQAWREVRQLVEAIVRHPFNVSLARGDLSRDIFMHYLAQDSLYLDGFARVLSAAAMRSPTAQDAVIWSTAARDTLLVERSLHDGWLAGMPSTEPSPTCIGYTSWLDSMALRGGYEVLTAAVLPCFWVYEHVGHVLLASCGALTEHPYREWLETYGSDEYSALVEAARGAVERAASHASSSSIAAMRHAFERATEFEWLFWDAAWGMQAWPTVAWRSG